jgi:hypothetical protein
MPKKLAAMYCKRHDEAGTRGWQVQVPGAPSEFFADRKHGGKIAAFAKARERAGELADRSRANPETGRFVRDPGATEGVFRIVVKGYAYWVAEWSPERGNKKQARFSVGKWGEAGAERKARDARRKRVAEIVG